MSDFAATDERLRRVKARVPDFAMEPMRLTRIIYLLHKNLREEMNAALRIHELAEASYTVLAILYGSPDETSTATALSDACQEKPANLTRVCDELVARGLVDRQPKPGDRRAVLLTLTDSGRTLIERVLPDISAKLATAFSGIDAAGLHQLAALNLRVLQGLERGGRTQGRGSMASDT